MWFADHPVRYGGPTTYFWRRADDDIFVLGKKGLFQFGFFSLVIGVWSVRSHAESRPSPIFQPRPTLFGYPLDD